jgi:hypothetical protein
MYYILHAHAHDTFLPMLNTTITLFFLRPIFLSTLFTHLFFYSFQIRFLCYYNNLFFLCCFQIFIHLLTLLYLFYFCNFFIE